MKKTEISGHFLKIGKSSKSRPEFFHDSNGHLAESLLPSDLSSSPPPPRFTHLHCPPGPVSFLSLRRRHERTSAMDKTHLLGPLYLPWRINVSSLSPPIPSYRGSQKQLTFLAHKLPTARATCIAFRPPSFPAQLLQSPLPGPGRGLPPPHRLRSGARGGSRPPAPGPRAPTAALCPGPGSPTAALGMLRGGRECRLAVQALALGSGQAAGARLQLELQRPELELPEFSPHPSLPARRSRSGRGSRERRRASTRAGRASSGARSPARGSPRRGLSLLRRVPRAGTAGTRTGSHGRAREGRGQSGGMRRQPPRRLGSPALGPRRAAGARTRLRGGRGRQALREMLSSWRAAGVGTAHP